MNQLRLTPPSRPIAVCLWVDFARLYPAEVNQVLEMALETVPDGHSGGTEAQGLLPALSKRGSMTLCFASRIHVFV